MSEPATKAMKVEGPTLEVGYWNIRGLGAPLRMMCFWADCRFQANCHCLVVVEGKIEYLQSDWHSKDKAVLKEKNPLINLPYVIDGDVVITQTNACMSYLGRKLNLWGTNDVEVSACEQLLCELYDLRGSMTGVAYGADGKNMEKVAAMIKRQSQHGNLYKLDLHLSRNPLFSETSPFLVGGHCTAPDFHLFEMLDQYNLMATIVLDNKDFLETMPRLKTFYHAWLKHEKMQKYLESDLHKLPLNSAGAKFGSCLDRTKTFDPATDSLHADASGIYP